MKAVKITKYGPPDVLRLEEVERPIPNDNQVLVKVWAASLNPVDMHRMNGPLLIRVLSRELRQPKNTFIGTDLAGIVEAVGKNVQQFKPGDAVFGVCGSAFAEYALAGKSKLADKPANVSFEAAAAAPVAALTALQGLRDKGKVQAGQRVLINGASGGVGTFAVQIAKAFGAEVTAVCSSRHIDVMRSIGADRVIDYTREDFTGSGTHYDLIFAVNGYHSIWEYRRALTPTGTYIAAGGSLRQVLESIVVGRLMSRFANQRLDFMGIATTSQEDLFAIRDLLGSGKVAPVIDRRYPLSEAPEAFRYLSQGHARGKVIITVENQAGGSKLI